MNDAPSRGALEQPIRVGRPRPGRKTFLELFPQLFLIPALIVTVIIFVMVLFSANEEKSTSALITDMLSGGEHSRKQAAFTLATRIVELTERGKPQYLSEEETNALLRLLERFPREYTLHRYVVIAVGRAGQPGKTLPILAKLVEKPDTVDEVKVAALEALGCTRSVEAVPVLLDGLKKLSGPDQWELRMWAIHAVASLRESTDYENPRAVKVLRGFVNDPRKEVSWNTAYYLARYFDDSTGIGVLWKLVDWEFLDRQRGDRGRELTIEQKEMWMQQALEGLYALEKEAAKKILEEKTQDRSLKVRNTAYTLLEKLTKENKEKRQEQGKAT